MYHDQRNVTLGEGRNTEPSCIEVSFVADRTSDIVELSACILSDLIASREVSCVEVAAAYLAQIGRINPTYNAIVSLREVLKNDDATAIKEKHDLLMQASMKIGEAIYKASQEAGPEAGGEAPPAGGGAGRADDGSTVVDADFEEVDERRKGHG